MSELISGFCRTTGTDLSELFAGILPLDVRHCTFMNQGKVAFEQIVLDAKLQRSRILFPAFFPDDFVGILRKYEITPVFVDVDPHTYHIDIDSITSEQLDGAKALIVLHTFGLPANGPVMRAFCDEHGLVMIEDCARALGASKSGSLVGSFGHYALFSLPKCTPVRQGGCALSERPLHANLRKAKVGVSGFLHAMTLVRYPLTSLIENRVYSAIADTPLYPREVGNYEARPAQEFDWLGRIFLESFMPHYREALAAKRECALRIRSALEADGFRFQSDEGEHIYTSLSVETPEGCNRDAFQAHLRKHGVKTSSMWREALGVSEFAQKEWGVEPQRNPAALHLSERLIQLPVSRSQTPSQSSAMVSLCKEFVRRGGSKARTAPQGQDSVVVSPGSATRRVLVPRADVLMYHGFYAGSGSASRQGRRSYTVSLEGFRSHVHGLKSALGVGPSTCWELARAGRGWAMTFDDGLASALAAADVVESLGWRAHFFITSGWVGRPDYMTSKQVLDLHERGHIIGSHSVSHPDPMSALSNERLLNEWRQSREFLEDLLGESVAVASVPGGSLSDNVARAAAEAGIEILFTSEPNSRIHHNSQDCAPALIGRYAIRNGHGVDTAVALATGNSLVCGSLRVGWKIRKVARKLLGDQYYVMRARILGTAAKLGGCELPTGGQYAMNGEPLVRSGAADEYHRADVEGIRRLPIDLPSGRRGDGARFLHETTGVVAAEDMRACRDGDNGLPSGNHRTDGLHRRLNSQ